MTEGQLTISFIFMATALFGSSIWHVHVAFAHMSVVECMAFAASCVACMQAVQSMLEVTHWYAQRKRSSWRAYSKVTAFVVFIALVVAW